MDDETELLLSRFRAATSTAPEDATRRAIWRSVLARTTARPRIPATTAWVVAFAVAAALVLLWAAREGMQGAHTLGEARPRDQALDRAQPSERGGDTLPRFAPALPPTPIAVPAPPATSDELDAPPLQRPSAVLPATSAPVPALAAVDDALSRESALLERARKATLAGDRSGARAAIDEHARSFPDGVLAPERWVLRIELACAAGAADEAAREAAAFADAHPHAKAARTLRDRPCDRVTTPQSRGQ